MTGWAVGPAVSDLAPPARASGAEPSGDAILDAAAVCVERRGFDNTSLEEIAVEAGVSRTTLYRRFGNRESLFKALLIARAQPFRKWSAQVLMGPGSRESRLETVFTAAILEMQRVGWLDQSLQAGMSAASVRLFKAAQLDGAQQGMAPLLETMIGPRIAEAGATLAEVIEWIADQMLALAGRPGWTEDELRKRLRLFVMPILASGAPVEPQIEDRLACIERRLDLLLSRRDTDGRNRPEE